MRYLRVRREESVGLGWNFNSNLLMWTFRFLKAYEMIYCINCRVVLVFVGNLSYSEQRSDRVVKLQMKHWNNSSSILFLCFNNGKL